MQSAILLVLSHPSGTRRQLKSLFINRAPAAGPRCVNGLHLSARYDRNPSAKFAASAPGVKSRRYGRL
jgi:hypothetical protein